MRKQRRVHRHLSNRGRGMEVADWKGVGLARVARQAGRVRALGQQKRTGLRRI